MKIVRINIDGSMNDISIKSVSIKNLDNISIRKGSTELKQLYKWKYNDKEIKCFGWYDGDHGSENKHDLIPGGNSSFLCDEDSSEKILFGDIFLTYFDPVVKKYCDFCVSDYGSIYEYLFDGFDDCESNEDEEEEDKENEEDISFINDENEYSDSDQDYSDSDEKELEEDTEEYTTDEDYEE